MVILSILPIISASASEKVDTIKVFYNQGKSSIDSTYRDNSTALRKLDSLIYLINTDSSFVISNIKIIGSASPEGSIAINNRISKKRGSSIIQYINDKTSIDNDNISIISNGINWELLKQSVILSELKYKNEIVSIIENIPEILLDSNGKIIDSRNKHLMDLKWGRPYNEMLDTLFPECRYSEGIITVSRKVERLSDDIRLEIIPPSLHTHSASIVPPQNTIVKKQRRPFYMGVSTNLLFDAALVPNIGIEFYLGKKWSLQGDWHYAWWNNDKINTYWRVYGGGVEARRWFGKASDKKPLNGHHIGIYGMILTYDFELGGRGYLGDKWSWSVGFGYGYSLPIAKRLNLDFGINIGYLGGEYKEYLPIDGHYVWQATKNRKYFGVTKGYVSLVWILGK